MVDENRETDGLNVPPVFSSNFRIFLHRKKDKMTAI